jgi:hypothetical protein
MQLRIAVLALFAIASMQGSRAWADDASIAAEVKAAMFALNDAFQAQDVVAIEGMVTPDHLGVSS